MRELWHQQGMQTPVVLPDDRPVADKDWMDSGQRARFRQWQGQTFHVDPRKVTWARRRSALLAVALVALVVSAVVLTLRTSSSLDGVVPLGLILLAAWRYASFALSGPRRQGPPRVPAEFRLCPVCGSLLTVKQLEFGWTAVCPACDYRLLLED